MLSSSTSNICSFGSEEALSNCPALDGLIIKQNYLNKVKRRFFILTDESAKTELVQRNTWV